MPPAAHVYVKVIGAVPVHVPGFGVRIWPTWAMPVIVGGPVGLIDGGVGTTPVDTGAAVVLDGVESLAVTVTEIA
jgi:hypothetical protein